MQCVIKLLYSWAAQGSITFPQFILNFPIRKRVEVVGCADHSLNKGQTETTRHGTTIRTERCGRLAVVENNFPASGNSQHLTERRKTKNEGRRINQEEHAHFPVIGIGSPASRNRPSLSTCLTESRKTKKEGRRTSKEEHPRFAVVGICSPVSRNRPRLSTCLTERRKTKNKGRRTCLFCCRWNDSPAIGNSQRLN